MPGVVLLRVVPFRLEVVHKGEVNRPCGLAVGGDHGQGRVGVKDNQA